MINQKLLNILCCPNCHRDLYLRENTFYCSFCQEEYKIINGIPVLLNLTKEKSDKNIINLSKEKWHKFYKNFNWEAERKKYNSLNLPYIYKHLFPIKENEFFLEIGSGPSFLSFDLAGKGIKVVCVDFDLEILKIAKKHFLQHRREGIFICANILRLPFKDELFDFSVGIGVIEHSGNLLKSIQEIKRVTKKNGYTFQTVPYLSLTTLINSSLRYGTVPHFPILNILFSFFHLKLLKGKLMKYGYEESFTLGFLKNSFKKSDFRKIEIDFYDYNQTIFKKYKLLGNIFYKIIRLKPFWDIVFIKAFK